MKISELIEKLEKYKEDQGDLDVVVLDGNTGEICNFSTSFWDELIEDPEGKDYKAIFLHIDD